MQYGEVQCGVLGVLMDRNSKGQFIKGNSYRIIIGKYTPDKIKAIHEFIDREL